MSLYSYPACIRVLIQLHISSCYTCSSSEYVCAAVLDGVAGVVGVVGVVVAGVVVTEIALPPPSHTHRPHILPDPSLTSPHGGLLRSRTRSCDRRLCRACRQASGSVPTPDALRVDGLRIRHQLPVRGRARRARQRGELLLRIHVYSSIVV